jgi:hypothetical protein
MVERTAIVSYSHKNRDHVLEFLDKLKPWFESDCQFRISFWRDEDGILVGCPWNETILEAFEVVPIYIPFVSKEFFESDYIRDIEIPLIVNTPGKIVMPVLLKPIDFTADLGGLQRLQIFSRRGDAYVNCSGDGRRRFVSNYFANAHDRLKREFDHE